VQEKNVPEVVFFLENKVGGRWHYRFFHKCRNDENDKDLVRTVAGSAKNIRESFIQKKLFIDQNKRGKLK
jgi:hypothetical protein